MDDPKPINPHRTILVKGLIASLAFVALNVAFFFSMSVKSQPVASPLAPVLTYVGAQEVQMKTSYASAFSHATEGATLATGSSLKTGDNSFAEFALDSTTVRLEPSTEIEFTLSDPDHLNLKLVSGKLWVDALLPVTVTTPSAYASFDHTMGSFSFKDDAYTAASYRGLTELNLLNSAQQSLALFVVPFRHDVHFAGAQLIDAYQVLQPSKLAKELKLQPLDDSLFADDWVKAHLALPPLDGLTARGGITSDFVYGLKNTFIAWRAKLAWSPERKEELLLSQLDLQSQYLLGVLQPRSDLQKANDVIAQIDALGTQMIPTDYSKVLESLFSRVRSAPSGTPAALLADHLLTSLFKVEGDPALFRSLLVDMDTALTQGSLSDALSSGKKWSTLWTADLESKYFEEFSLEQRLFHSLVIAHADTVSSDLIALLDQAGAVFLARNSDELLLEITQQRLDLVKALLAVYRYPEAKAYLRNSYQTLALDQLGTAEAARQIFLEEANLIAQRIAFAESQLHGAAQPINEVDFQAYLDAQKRDNYLTSLLQEFITPSTPAVTPAPVAPAPSEISLLFIANDLQVQEENLTPVPDYPFEFRITGAQISGFQIDSKPVTFDATYDSKAKALYDVTIGGKPFNGSFALADFSNLVQKSFAPNPSAPTAAEATAAATSDITQLLNSTDELTRAQTVAKDLAVQLLIKEMVKVGIHVASDQKVQLLNGDLLTRFRILEAQVTDPAKPQAPIVFSFDYDLQDKKASRIQVTTLDNALTSTGTLDQVPSLVISAVNFEASKAAALQSIVQEWKAKSILLASKSIVFTSSDLNQFTFQDAQLTTQPITFSGTYDRSTQKLVEGKNSLYSAKDVSMDEYLKTLVKRVVIDLFNTHELTLTEAQVLSDPPFTTIEIKDLVKGANKYSFLIDMANNRLLQVKTEGSASVLDALTFEQFKAL